MANFVTETIAHFIGYLHLDQLFNLDAKHYSGAPVYTTRAYTSEPPKQVSSFPAELPERAGSPALPNPHVEPPSGHARLPGSASAPDPVLVSEIPVMTIEPPESVQVPRVEFAISSSQKVIDPSVTYTIGGRQDMLVDVLQRNTLLDDDTVLDRLLAVGDLSVSPQVAERIQFLVETAVGEVPDGMWASFGLPTGVSRQHSSIGDAVDIGPGDDAPRPASYAHAVGPDGTHVNGVQVDDEGQSLIEQSDTLAAVIQSIMGEGQIGDTRTTAHAPKPEFSTEAAQAFAPTGGVAQIVSAGGNEAANVTALYDLGDAFGSRIIVGDYYERNIIAQVNVLDSSGGGGISDLALLSTVLKNDSGLRNEAAFVSEPGLLYGTPTFGYPGAIHWQVDYVNGDLVDITSVIQRNFVIDNDISQSTQSTAHQVVTLGENDQINIASLAELGKSYDLIIIGGDYFKYNAIFQFNIVIDEDAVFEWTDHGGRLTYGSGGNSLVNDAAIVGIGGNLHNPLTAEATALSDAIGGRAATLNGAWTIGLPGNGNDIFEVLYVAGNYHSYNILLQSNIMSDVDAIARSLTEGDSAETGRNTASNVALIYDLESQSAYQMIGGEAYEESFLIQANIIFDETTEAQSSLDLENGLVAVLTAMGEDAPVSAHTDDDAGFVPASAHADVLGAMLH